MPITVWCWASAISATQAVAATANRIAIARVDQRRAHNNAPPAGRWSKDDKAERTLPGLCFRRRQQRPDLYRLQQFGTDERHQRVGNPHTAVGPLVVFQD